MRITGHSQLTTLTRYFNQTNEQLKKAAAALDAFNSMDETLRREMREELGVEVEVVRLLWFVENFFTYAGKRYHEIALYFLMRLPNDCELLSHPGPFRGEEAGTPLILQWFSRKPETLSSLPLLPSFLQTALQDLPESIERVIQS